MPEYSERYQERQRQKQLAGLPSATKAGLTAGLIAGAGYAGQKGYSGLQSLKGTKGYRESVARNFVDMMNSTWIKPEMHSQAGRVYKSIKQQAEAGDPESVKYWKGMQGTAKAFEGPAKAMTDVATFASEAMRNKGKALAIGAGVGLATAGGVSLYNKLQRSRLEASSKDQTVER